MKQETFPSVANSVPKRRWRWPVAALILFGVATSGWMITRPKASVPDKPAKQETPALELAQSDVGTIEARPLHVTLPIAGSLTPMVQATVKAKVAGELQDPLVQEGLPVSRGQVIARINSAEINARIATQQGSLEEAQARLNLAEKNNGANSALLKQNYISQNAFDTSKSNVELAQANVKSARANAEIARIALADSVVHAPIGGIIARRHAQAGEKVSPDMPIYTIVNLDQLNLEAQVPASEIARIKIDQSVSFQVDGFTGRTFTGKVARINPTTEAGSRAIVVYISVANKNGELKGGMFAKGTIVTQQSEHAPLVPLAALRLQKGQQVVYAIENNKVVARPVQLGLRNEDEGLVQVNSGINAGARIIVAPLPDVKPGASVKLPPVSSASSGPADRGPANLAASSAQKG